MLPLLFLPVVAPVVIGAVEASAVVLGNGAAKDVIQWLPLLAAYDAILIVVCAFTFHLVVEE